jgi:hypothetical protein
VEKLEKNVENSKKKKDMNGKSFGTSHMKSLR